MFLLVTYLKSGGKAGEKIKVLAVCEKSMMTTSD